MRRHGYPPTADTPWQAAIPHCGIRRFLQSYQPHDWQQRFFIPTTNPQKVSPLQRITPKNLRYVATLDDQVSQLQ